MQKRNAKKGLATLVHRRRHGHRHVRRALAAFSGEVDTGSPKKTRHLGRLERDPPDRGISTALQLKAGCRKPPGCDCSSSASSRRLVPEGPNDCLDPRFKGGSRRLCGSIKNGLSGGLVHGTRGSGHWWDARYRRGHLESPAGGRLSRSPPITPAMTKRRQKFKAETGIAVYKWDVSRPTRPARRACSRSRPISVRSIVLVNNAGITRDGDVPPHDAGAVERR